MESKWKEYTSATGKKYYFNTETRVTLLRGRGRVRVRTPRRR